MRILSLAGTTGSCSQALMIQLIEFAAVASSGVFGILLARKNQLDFIGVFTVAFITAFAGGTLRDLFLDRHPLFWIANDRYAILIFAMTLVSTFIPSRQSKFQHWLNLPDALGLGLFAIVGANHALAEGTSLFIASLLGVVTGTAGGAISDIICNEVPRLFKSSPLYATCAFVGCWSYFGLQALPLPESLALTGGILVVVVSRLATLRYHLCLPEHQVRKG